jgi:O-acetyl-ADP-ribose deacetylase (regulator of RNase III)
MKTTDKIEIINGNIVEIAKKYNVDAIVNAAKPTLMGGSGVDGAIHNVINKINHEDDFLKNKIIEELDGSPIKRENSIRCKHGSAVITQGYGLTNYIIHAVGPRWDGNDKNINGSCSKTCIDKLKDCYSAVFDIMLVYGINSIAIPVISSGSYRFPFAIAAKVELVAICNFLTKLKKQDYERFEKIEKIYIVVYDEKDLSCFDRLTVEMYEYVNKGEQLLYLNAEESYGAYLAETKYYDSERRNYFSLVKYIRLILVKSEKFFFITNWLKKMFADKTWERRRVFIELETIVKCLIPLIFLYLSPYMMNGVVHISIAICIFLMLETLTYVTKLLFLSDILNPSANNIRSVLLLSINYLEVNFCFAYFYQFYKCFEKMGRIASLYAAFEHSSQVPINDIGMILVVIHNCITFYFIGVILSYFVGNFQTRKFNL